MSAAAQFPVIRPGDVRGLPPEARAMLLAWLATEMEAAAQRHRTILAERAERRLAVLAEPRPRPGRPVAPGAFTAEERHEAEALLRRHRHAVLLGHRAGDGTRDDDLRAAHAAAKAGSTNGYLLALDREYMRTRRAVQRQAHAAHRSVHRGRAVA